MARKATPTAETTADVSPARSVQEVPMMKKPDLLDLVVARTNLKKRDVKPAVEAAFAVMAEAMRDGTDLNLPPLGKVRVVKKKELDGGATVLTLKLRTPKNAVLAAPIHDDDDA